MPHFVVRPFHDKEHYGIENPYVERHSDGSQRWPEPIAVVEIPEYVAALGLDTLIKIWNGYRVRTVFITGERLAINIAMLKLQKKEITNATATENIGANRLRIEGGHSNIGVSGTKHAPTVVPRCRHRKRNADRVNGRRKR